MTHDRKILYVTTALIAGPHTGCMIRTLNVCRQLAKYGRVTMLAVSDKFDAAAVEMCKDEFPDFHQITLKAYSDFSVPWGELKRKWDMHSPFKTGMIATRLQQEQFSDLAGACDIIWFHTLNAAGPFRARPRKAAVMDLDDLNHCKYDMRAAQDARFRFKCSAKVQSFKWKRLEYQALKDFDIVTVCSQCDQQYLATDNVRVVPNGFTLPPQKPQWAPGAPDRLGFIGTLGYGPNRSGLLWFRDKVWPQILAQRPSMQLRIIGTPPEPRYQVSAPGFTPLGYIEDPSEEMRTWSAMIVPIIYGGGTRIKILDAFSRLCPVVSTPMGAHGIEVQDTQHILLAPTETAFADSCLSLAQSPQRAHTLAEAAWHLFTEKYTWDKIGLSVRDILNEITARKIGSIES